jgi:hypothetical protein
MGLYEAIDAIRQRLVSHRLAGTTDLWSTILKQIKERDSFDGEHADTILEIIRSFLLGLDDESAIQLWRATETGMADDTEDECLFPDGIRMDLEMELLKEIIDSAWSEAKEGI